MYSIKLYYFLQFKECSYLFIQRMFETLIERVRANIDERKPDAEQDRTLIRGWTFSEEHGVCPIRCKYESTIKGVDIELRKDVCDQFGRNNLILSGWKIYVPQNKYVDFQIKLGSDWVTFVSTNTLAEKIEVVESLSSAPAPVSAPDSTPVSAPVSAPTPVANPRSRSNLMIVDSFYNNPNDVRQYALSVANQPNIPFQAKSELERVLGRPLQTIQEHEFTLTNRSTPATYHMKSYQYYGMVFLTPDAPITSGITLYRSKTNKSLTMNEEQLRSIQEKQSYSTDLEAVDIIGNVYNRLVVFDPTMIHAVSHHFGQEQQGRLVQTFAFHLA